MPIHLPKILDEKRIYDYAIHNELLNFNYSAAHVTETTLTALQALADEQNVIPKYHALLSGKTTQHHRTRSTENRGIHGETEKKFLAFSKQIRSGTSTGYSGKAFKSVVQVGIGGSDLGPRAVCHALISAGYPTSLNTFFLVNNDPAELTDILKQIELETTLFLIVSKSGTTQETCTNLSIIESLFKEKKVAQNDLIKHLVSITMPHTPMDDSTRFSHTFYMDTTIGGRFSVTSACGGVLLSLAFGDTLFSELLTGAEISDRNALNPKITHNMSLLSALIGIWNHTYLGHTELAIVPYGEAFEWWPLHLQQLFCESLGKSIDIDGNPILYPVGSLVFGSIGSAAQHAYFQQLHQGQKHIPVQFIATTHSSEMLLKNLVAQTVSLACGNNADFPGNRSSTLIYCNTLTPKTIGALIAFYENVVMFQGFLWHVNAFDQPGVELGKTLMRNHNANPHDQNLMNAYLALFTNTKPGKNAI
jgi:glucose-6-phosphate isomerase